MAPSSALLFSPTRLKVTLRLAVQRLKLLQQKKASLNAQQRKELSLLLEAGKVDSARVRVENVIREDNTSEALEVLELYCELLLARFSLIESMAVPDAGILEAVHTLIYAAPRTEVKELHTVRELLAGKYGRDVASSAVEDRAGIVNRRVVSKLKVQAPSRRLVNAYLGEIANAYNVQWDAPEDDGGDELDGYGGSAVATGSGPAPATVGKDGYAAYDASAFGYTPSADTPVNPALAGPPRIPKSAHLRKGPQYITDDPSGASSSSVSSFVPVSVAPTGQQQQQQFQQPYASSAAPAPGPPMYYGAAPPPGGPVPTHYMDGTPIPMGMPHQFQMQPPQMPQPPPTSMMPTPMPMPMPMPSPMGGGGGPSMMPSTSLPPYSSASSTLVGMQPHPDAKQPQGTERAAAAAPLGLTDEKDKADDGDGDDVDDDEDLDLPNVPSNAPAGSSTSHGGGSGAGASSDGVPDFDELARRFEALKNRK